MQLVTISIQKQPAENLLSLETYKKWACADPSEKKVIVVLQVCWKTVWGGGRGGEEGEGGRRRGREREREREGGREGGRKRGRGEGGRERVCMHEGLNN